MQIPLSVVKTDDQRLNYITLKVFSVWRGETRNILQLGKPSVPVNDETALGDDDMFIALSSKKCHAHTAVYYSISKHRTRIVANLGHVGYDRANPLFVAVPKCLFLCCDIQTSNVRRNARPATEYRGRISYQNQCEVTKKFR